jgi:excisionase family DNA binding protein
MENIILQQITVDELVSKTAQKVTEQIRDLLPKQEKQESYLTFKEVAKLLQLSLPTLHEYCKSGLIPSYRLGRNIRFKRSEIDHIITKGLRFIKKEGGRS